MDEPTTGLDVVVQREILNQILDLKARLGFSILLITHDLALVSEFCDRIGVMHGGRLVEAGPTDALLADPTHSHTRRLWEALPRFEAVAGIAEDAP